ncbi:MAG: ammonium transporter, partial [Deltaproteobacteria bacterium]|nr:ammonium transporter [Deltaproteobacteria bacterium]
PVGAISVHLICGAFGTLALGLFAQDQFMPGTTGNGLLFGGGMKLLLAQFAGVVSVGIFVFGSSWVFWNLIKATVGLRVSPEEELEGLDVGEHGIMAYPEFQSPGDSMPLEERNERSVILPRGQLIAEREKI